MRRAPVALLGGLVLVLAAASVALAQPTEADVHVAEGVLALEEKRYEAALEHFQRALAREPGHVEALYYSGVAWMAQDRPDQALPFLERAHELAPADAAVGYQLGLAYLALDRLGDAQRVLEEVFEREPELDGLGYWVGFLRYRRGDHQAALEAFRAARTTDPDLAQLIRFYTGLTLAALGLPGQAAAEVEHAVRLQPASPLTGPAERLRESFARAREGERRLRIEARLGAYFDDNAITQPDADPGDPVVELLREPEHETTGELFSLRLEYEWLRQGPWTSTASYSFFATYNNDLPSFNVTDHLAALAVSRQGLLGAMPVVAGAQYAYEYLTLDEDELLQRHVGALFGTLVESATHLTTALGKVELKEYSELQPIAREEFQDGTNYLVGLLHVMRFGQGRHLIKLGYQFDVEDSEGDNLAYHGHRLLAGFRYTLPWWGLRLLYDFSLHHRDYRNPHSLLPLDNPGSRERSDQEYSHLVRLELPLPRGFTLGLDYQGTDQRSNLAPFAYHRNLYTLSLSWAY